MAFTNSDKTKALGDRYRINLSKRARTIVEEDMIIFENEHLSNIVNRIVMSFRDSAKASIGVALAEKEKELREALEDLNFAEKERVIKVLKSKEEAKLKKRFLTEEKGKSEFVRLWSDNIDVLSRVDCQENKYYGNKVSKYLKALVEEYTTLPFYERERIYCGELIEQINNFINKKKMMCITLSKGGVFHMLPVAVVSDTMKNYNYVVGYTINPETGKKYSSSYRLSRISKVNKSQVVDNTKSKYKDDMEELSKEIADKGAQFLLSSEQDIVVRLTEEGKESFKMIQHLRPHVKENKGNEYYFKCTKKQAEYYFRRLGKDAYVVSPEELRKDLKNFYKDAYETYNTNE